LDIFTASAGIHTIKFQITECEPGKYCSGAPSIEMHTEGEPFECKDDDKAGIGDAAAS
jgi:hypothetical protein